jgi:hypothetical protein
VRSVTAAARVSVSSPRLCSISAASRRTCTPAASSYPPLTTPHRLDQLRPVASQDGREQHVLPVVVGVADGEDPLAEERAHGVVRSGEAAIGGAEARSAPSPT